MSNLDLVDNEVTKVENYKEKVYALFPKLLVSQFSPFLTKPQHNNLISGARKFDCLKNFLGCLKKIFNYLTIRSLTALPKKARSFSLKKKRMIYTVKKVKMSLMR